MEFAYTLSHFLFPRHTNNYKAKLLHTSSLLLIAFFLIAYQLFLQTLPMTGIKILGYAANIPPDQVVSLTNQKRIEAGLPALASSSQLTEAARRKGEHMLEYDYWAHVAPDGTEPWKFFTDQGYKYRYAGENLARDFSNPQDAINAWMASPSHKENMLSSKYKEMGIAVVEGDLGGVDTTIIVQFFGTQLTDTSSQVPVAEAKPRVNLVPSPTATPLPSLTPTLSLTPTQYPIIAQSSPIPGRENLVTENIQAQQRSNAYQILISPFESTRGVALATTTILLIVLAIDGLIVARRRIPRIGGRTFAHLAFLGMILAILLIAKAGKIL